MVIKYVILQYLTDPEIAKLALACKESNKIIDCNKYKTGDGKLEMHLQLMVMKKNINFADLKIEEVDAMMTKIKQIQNDENILV